MSGLKKLTKTELEFMQVIWREDCDMCLRDFIRIFHGEFRKKWERSTLSVYLNKLTTKGYLQYYRKGKVFYYHPIISRLEYKQQTMNQTFEDLYDSKIEGVIAAFCGNEKPTNNDILKIRKWLEEQVDD